MGLPLCGLGAAGGTKKGRAEMRYTAPLSCDRGHEQVEDMVERGVPFGHVEDAIDGARLSQAHKAALWLFAWSLRDPTLQRRDARLTLELVRVGSLGGR